MLRRLCVSLAALAITAVPALTALATSATSAQAAAIRPEVWCEFQISDISGMA